MKRSAMIVVGADKISMAIARRMGAGKKIILGEIRHWKTQKYSKDNGGCRI